jgi:hypothetical protein
VRKWELDKKRHLRGANARRIALLILAFAVAVGTLPLGAGVVSAETGTENWIITAFVPPEEGEYAGENYTYFESGDIGIYECKVPLGTSKDDIPWPTALTVTICDANDASVESKDIEVPVILEFIKFIDESNVTIETVVSYDPNCAGIYIYRLVPQGYDLEDDITSPEVHVRVDAPYQDPQDPVIEILTYTQSGTELTITDCYEGATSEQVAEALAEICVVYDEFGAIDETVTNTIVAIGEEAFEYCNNLTEITLPDSVTTIVSGAFRYCRNLESVVIPENSALKTIGSDAFRYCGALKSVDIPGDVTTIGSRAFQSCYNLESVVIPENSALKTIGSGAFAFCYALKSIELPNSVTSVGGSAFERCTSLTAFIWPKSAVGAMDAFIFKDCTGLISVELPEGLTTIGQQAFDGCAALEIINIPVSVTKIDRSAFYGCSSLPSIDLSANLTTIGSYAFCGCSSLTEIELPDHLTTVELGAFSGCLSLTVINLPAGVSSIGTYAFYGCVALTGFRVDDGNSYFSSGDDGVMFNKYKTALIQYPVGNERSSYTIPGSVTGIGDYAFDGAVKLTEIDLPANLTTMGNSAFSGCSAVTEIDLPAELLTIGNGAFYGCSALKEIVIPNTVTKIGSQAFAYCGALVKVILSSRLTGADAIGWGTFYDCVELKSVIIPEGVTGVSESMFSGCVNLESVSTSESLESIGDNAFEGCAAIESVNISAKVSSIGTDAFYGCSSLIEIKVAEENENYASEEGVLFDKNKTTLIQYPVGNLRTEYTVPDSVTSVGDLAFYGCAALCEVCFSGSAEEPGNLISIGHRAFEGCISLVNVYIIQEGATYIGARVFYGCVLLRRVLIPGGVTSIGMNSFHGCDNLQEINIGEGESTDAGYYTDKDGVLFYSDTNYSPANVTLIRYPSASTLTEYAVPEGVTVIDDSAFSGASALKEIKLPEGLETIGGYAFAGTGLTELRVPSTIKRLGQLIMDGDGSGDGSAFNDMPALRWIVFKSGITGLPAGAMVGNFANAVGVYVPNSVTYISDDEDAEGLPPSDNLTVCGFANSYAATWAAEQGIPFVGIEGEISKFDYGDAWLFVPYQYIIEVDLEGVQDANDIEYEVVAGSLPEGLKLLETGQFHGAPLETGSFTFFVAIKYTGFGDGGTATGDDNQLDLQAINLVVESPGDEQLAETNDYPIDEDFFIGELSAGGVYVLEIPVNLLTDLKFKINDVDMNSDGKIDESDSNFKYFADFWIDGNRMKRYDPEHPEDEYDYAADEGSTVVTVLKKTIQDLDNNEEHTVAAEFMTPGADQRDLNVSKVAAQKFTLKLTAPVDTTDPTDQDPGEGVTPPDSGDPGEAPPEGGDPVENPPGPGDGGDPADTTDPDNSDETDESDNTGNPGNPANPINPTIPGNSGNPDTPNDTSNSEEPANPTIPANPIGGTAGNPAASGDPQNPVAPGDQDSPVSSVNPADTADNTETPAVNDATPVSGLAADENGSYFALDGSGAPLEMRIDIPLEEFEALRFDGADWSLEEDYTVRSGSTILTVTAARLELCGAGKHTIQARFLSETVEIVFELRKIAPAQDPDVNVKTETAAAEDETPAADDEIPAVNDEAPADEKPTDTPSVDEKTAPVMLLIAVGLLIFCGAAVILFTRARGKRRVGE